MAPKAFRTFLVRDLRGAERYASRPGERSRSEDPRWLESSLKLIRKPSYGVVHGDLKGVSAYQLFFILASILLDA